MFEKKCVNGGRFHKFEPRYSENPSGLSAKNIQYTTIEGLRKLFIAKIYIKDVCIWCGKEIKK